MLRCFCSQLEGAECVTLDSGESHHLVTVLRAGRGTEVELLDGCGTVAGGRVVNPDRNAAQIMVESVRVETRRFELLLIQAALANKNTEFVLREACAIGASGVCVLQAERSESRIQDRIDSKLAHWNKLLVEACKQSGNPFLPKLSFARRVEDLSIGENFTKFFGDLDGEPRHLIEKLSSMKEPFNIAIAIGPEGDFTRRERDFLIGKNFIGCRLSNNVLRSETAAIYALSVANNYVDSLC